MRLFQNLSALAILVCVCDARPTSSVVFEKVESSPAGWVLDKAAKVDKDATSITLKIHLVNQGMDKFHKLAMDVIRAPC
jgi:tripeptidyl-peptidase-1